MSSIAPDAKENKSVGGGKALSNGSDRVSGAELIIDGTNKYKDNWALNNSSRFKTIYTSKLSELGYKDGTLPSTLYGGSDEPYKLVSVFFVSNSDFENGKKATLEFGDYSLDFDMAEIKEVNSPLSMIDELSVPQE